MQRFFAIILITCYLIFLVACGHDKNVSPTERTENTTLAVETPTAQFNQPNVEETLYNERDETEFEQFKTEITKDNSLIVTIENKNGERLALLDDAMRYHTILNQCEWRQNLEECLPDDFDYTLMLHFRGLDLKLFSGSTAAVINENGRIRLLKLIAPMEYPDSKGSAANQIRRECFDATEVRMRIDDIHIIDGELESVAEQYNRQVNESLKNLFAGSCMGIEDYAVLRTEVISYNEDRTKLVFYAENALKPNEVQSLIWWAGGSGTKLGEGELDGYIIREGYYELELINGNWVSTEIREKDDST